MAPSAAAPAVQETINLADLLTLRQAAKLLPGLRGGERINHTTLWRWVQAGKIPAYRIGSAWFVLRGDLTKLVTPAEIEVQPRIPTRAEVEQEARERTARTLAILAEHGIAYDPAPPA
jgi:hypothetical protein